MTRAKVPYIDAVDMPRCLYHVYYTTAVGLVAADCAGYYQTFNLVALFVVDSI